uniref:Uncharacterized protein n=1 Tax=Mycena chlorophos TaxID=658473 RepID=A0ABQ0MDI8_MYCCL|nr:predicted protein [Mycena chlorophos]
MQAWHHTGVDLDTPHGPQHARAGYGQKLGLQEDVGVGEFSTVLEAVYVSFECERVQDDRGGCMCLLMRTTTPRFRRHPSLRQNQELESAARPDVWLVSVARRLFDHHLFDVRNLRRSCFSPHHCCPTAQPTPFAVPHPTACADARTIGLLPLRTACPSACYAHGCAAVAPLARAPMTLVACANLHLALGLVRSSHESTTRASDNTTP